MSIAAIQAARDWAAEHRHQQPDDRMLRVCLAVALHELAGEIEAHVAESKADPDYCSGEAIWEQNGYWRGLATAVEELRDEADAIEPATHPAFPGDAR